MILSIIIRYNITTIFVIRKMGPHKGYGLNNVGHTRVSQPMCRGTQVIPREVTRCAARSHQEKNEFIKIYNKIQDSSCARFVLALAGDIEA